ncbi:hypothetical protein TrVE_jg4678 [Triparma verrucosa]|uniref:Uncharacterized protein n=1 Tax=Triparma verrucosa TaxID=1606542 RepID=A0A9W7EQR7_9STRA|nr:hypothetical protein TrVE_jg4678 [Triparma verrucosa]
MPPYLLLLLLLLITPATSMTTVLTFTTPSASYLVHDTRAPSPGGQALGIKQPPVVHLSSCLVTAIGSDIEVERFLNDLKANYHQAGDLKKLISRMLYERNREHAGGEDDDEDKEDNPMRNFDNFDVLHPDPNLNQNQYQDQQEPPPPPYQLQSVHLSSSTSTTSFDSIGSASTSTYTIGGSDASALVTAFVAGAKKRSDGEQIFKRYLDRQCEAGGEIVVWRLKDGGVGRKVIKGRSDL